MSNELNKHFILKRIFPEANSILTIKTKTIDHLFKDALFVLDTNTLLAPFQAGKEGIEKLGKIYSKLVKAERLYIPQHVLREFAKNRSIKISELFHNIDNLISNMHRIKSFEYPILNELSIYKDIQQKQKKINDEINSYGKDLAELKIGITNWNWADPVSTMYSNTFSEKTIIDSSLSEEELLKEYNTRIENDIPPGNKDKTKDTNAIGDFLIWKTILELAKEKKKNIIFVSNDEKNDWQLKGSTQSICTRFELVNEFYNETKGKNFISITFEKFLELQGVEIDLIPQISTFDLSALHLFENEEDSFQPGTLKSLEKIYEYILIYLQFYEDDEDVYINNDIESFIKHFLTSHKGEFFGTNIWKKFSHLLFKFNELLSKIETLNYEITYQAHRQKKSTYASQIEMHSLCVAFVKLYEAFHTQIVSEL